MQSFRRLLITQSSFGMHTRSRSKAATLTHDDANKEFHMKVNSGVATVNYERNGDVFDLVHSNVPESVRGKGIGRILAKNTFDYIDQNNWKMKITCHYLKHVYEENKNKYEHLIVED